MSEYVTRNNEDIFNVVNKTIGDLNNVYSFLLENEAVQISFVPALLTVSYTTAIFQPPNVNSSAPTAAPLTQTYRSRKNQTIYDVCLMTLTDLNKIYTLNFNNITTPPVAGTLFNFNPKLIFDNILTRYVADNNIVFSTSEKILSVTGKNFILRQDGGYLLRQDGGRFIRQNA